MKFSALTVGIHEDAGETEDGLTVAQVAAFHEFGTVNIPERSFLRATLDSEKPQIESLVKDVTRQVISNRRRLGSKRALSILGADIQRRIQGTIRRRIPPELKSRVGTPLIASSQLIGSIAFKVS